MDELNLNREEKIFYAVMFIIFIIGVAAIINAYKNPKFPKVEYKEVKHGIIFEGS